MPNKLLIMDLETTGLDPVVHEILEIGAMCIDITTLNQLWTFEIKVRPERIETAQPKALEVNGYNTREWENALDLDQGFSMLHRLLSSDMCLMSQNITFDYGFYTAALHRFGFEDPLDYHRLDLCSMAFPFQEHPVYSLSKLSTLFGVEREAHPHRAMNGVKNAYEVLRILCHNGRVHESMLTYMGTKTSRGAYVPRELTEPPISERRKEFLRIEEAPAPIPPIQVETRESRRSRLERWWKRMSSTE